jgi:hypothetical protein
MLFNCCFQLKIRATRMFEVTEQSITTDVPIEVIRNPNAPTITSPTQCFAFISETTAQGTEVVDIDATDNDQIVSCLFYFCSFSKTIQRIGRAIVLIPVPSVGIKLS